MVSLAPIVSSDKKKEAKDDSAAGSGQTLKSCLIAFWAIIIITMGCLMVALGSVAVSQAIALREYEQDGPINVRTLGVFWALTGAWILFALTNKFTTFSLGWIVVQVGLLLGIGFVNFVVLDNLSKNTSTLCWVLVTANFLAYILVNQYLKAKSEQSEGDDGVAELDV